MRRIALRLDQLQRLRRSGATAAAARLCAPRQVLVGAGHFDGLALRLDELKVLWRAIRCHMMATAIRAMGGFALDLVVLAHHVECLGCHHGNCAFEPGRRCLDIFGSRRGLGGRLMARSFMARSFMARSLGLAFARAEFFRGSANGCRGLCVVARRPVGTIASTPATAATAASTAFTTFVMGSVVNRM
ncbi:MAG: hypothetical protein WA190_04315 [Usitatibacter sp.]